jgi:hypothetical protein
MPNEDRKLAQAILRGVGRTTVQQNREVPLRHPERGEKSSLLRSPLLRFAQHDAPGVSLPCYPPDSPHPTGSWLALIVKERGAKQLRRTADRDRMSPLRKRCDRTGEKRHHYYSVTANGME